MSNKIEGIPLSQGPQPSLLCPACGCDCSHIREVYTEMGTNPYEAGVYSGTEVKGRTGSRRSALAIVIDGECGHRWILRIQQHKGNNLVECEVTPTVKDKLDGEVLRLRTMLKVAGDTLQPDDALLSRRKDCLKDTATKIGQLRVDALIEEGL